MGRRLDGARIEPLAPRPAAGRVFAARRRIRLSDMDAAGRLRLDAVARYLQDVASDDVEEAGWGSHEHVWIVRRTRIDVLAPLVADEWVELATWCSGTGGSAAGRRTSLAGDRGGRVETETIWIHLSPDGRPVRLTERFFATYGAAGADRRVSPRLSLPDPPPGSERVAWPLRATDVDMLGHVNNAAYWQAVEELLDEPARPLRAVLEHRGPLDREEEGELVRRAADGRLAIGFAAAGEVRAAASVEAL